MLYARHVDFFDLDKNQDKPEDGGIRNLVTFAAWHPLAISKVFSLLILQESLAEVAAFFLGAFEVIFSGVFALTFLVALAGAWFFAIGSISLRVFVFSLTTSLATITTFVLPTWGATIWSCAWSCATFLGFN